MFNRSRAVAEVHISKFVKALWAWCNLFYGVHVIFFASMLFYMISNPETATIPYKIMLIACFLLTLVVLVDMQFASRCLDLAIDTEDDLDKANVFRRRMETILKHYNTVIKSLEKENSSEFKNNKLRLVTINDMLINLAVDDGFLVDTKIYISNEELDALKVAKRVKR